MMHACLTYRARFYVSATFSILFALFVSRGIASPGLTRTTIEEWQLMDRNDIMVFVGFVMLLLGIAAISFTLSTTGIDRDLLALSGIILIPIGFAVTIRYGLETKR